MKRYSLLLCLVVLAACGRQTGRPRGDTAPPPTPESVAVAPAATPSPKADPNDPAEVKRRFLETIQAAIAKAAPGIKKPQTQTTTGLDGRPEKDTYVADYNGRYTYDIKRSDSIVTPFTGTVSWKFDWYHNDRRINSYTSLDATYDYRDGKWVFKTLKRDAGTSVLPADEYLPFFD